MKSIILYAGVPEYELNNLYHIFSHKKIYYRLLIEKEIHDVSLLEEISDILITAPFSPAKKNPDKIDSFIFNSFCEFVYHAKKNKKEYIAITSDKNFKNYLNKNGIQNIYIKKEVQKILSIKDKNISKNNLLLLIENVSSSNKDKLLYLSLEGNEIIFGKPFFTPFSTFFELAEWRHAYDGLLVVFEGIDGSGKSTQIELVYNFFSTAGKKVIKMREPSNSKYGKIIREKMKDDQTLTPEEEYELFMKDRELHFKEKIFPALKKGFIVLLDRFYHSTYAYQKAKGIDGNRIIQENMRIVIKPDIVFIFDIFVGEAIRRIKKTRKNLNKLFEKKDYLMKVRENYFDFSGKGVHFISAEQSIESIYEFVIRKIEEKLYEKSKYKNSF